MARFQFDLMAVFALILTVILPAVMADATAKAETSDGTTIDQAIAYLLMLFALVVTYLVH